MARLLVKTLFSLSLFSAACSVAYADRIAAPPHRPLVPIAVAPEAVRSPYTVEVVAEDGGALDTFFHKGRYYVHGSADQRYTIRVYNPTPQRVEAVVSVDGLDVVDGEAGDLRKRGYVVPAYGEVRIEGWRTSLSDVASFRFSSVKGSYAGRKGKARNVGVVAVAIFAEQAPAELILRQDPPDDYDYDDEDYGEVEEYLDRRWSGGAPGATRGQAQAEAGGSGNVRGRVTAKPAAPPPADSPAGGDGRFDRAPEPAPRTATATGGSVGATAADKGAGAPARMHLEESDCCGGRDTAERRAPERLGLGTEYGEQRYSAASYTRFVRSSDRPVAVAELRYNDTAGLKALGILVDPLPDAGEIMTRETADPFPGDRGFARPPAGIR